MKHSNFGCVLGKIGRITHRKQKEQKPRLVIKVDCDGPFGEVIAFCNIWNQSGIVDFKREFSEGDTVKLSGYMAQYEKAPLMMTTFNIYKAVPWDPGQDDNRCRRAAFNVCGEVTGMEEKDGFLEAAILIKRDSFENDLILWLPEDYLFDISKGGHYHFEGHLRQREGHTRPEVEKKPREAT